MNNITKTVWKYIDSDAAIRQGLQKRVINTRGLAVYFIKRKKLDAEINAVISAIRRYEDEQAFEDSLNKVMDILKDSTLSSKSGIVSLTLEKTSETERALPKLFSVIDMSKQEALRIIQASRSIKVIVDKKNLSKAKKMIPERCIKKIDLNLAEVIILLDERAWATPGVQAALTTELTMSGINIIESMTCIPEMIFFFKEKDFLKAYNVLYSIGKDETK